MTPTAAPRRSRVLLTLLALSVSLGAVPAFALPSAPLAGRLDAALAANRDAMIEWRRSVPGRVLLVFRPAEEGVPIQDQPAGAELMLKARVFDDPRPAAVFGLHVFAQTECGLLGYRRGPLLAAADRFEILVQGRQAHGSKPWVAIDPSVVGSEIVTALQTDVSRTVDVTREPAVVDRMIPTLERLAPGRARKIPKTTGAEDFSFFANRAPGFFVILGVTPADQTGTATSNRSARCFVDEAALPTGTRALAHLAADFLFAGGPLTA